MMVTIGFVLAQVFCDLADNCKVKPLDTRIYASQSECEFDRQAKAPFYPLSETQCVEVSRSVESMK